MRWFYRFIASVVPLSLAWVIMGRSGLVPFSRHSESFVAWQYWAARLWRDGQMPLWNPHLNLGVSSLTEPSSGVFSFATLPWFSLLSPDRSVVLILGLGLFALSISCYAWMRSWCHNRSLSLVAAMAVSLGGPTWLVAENLSLFVAVSFVPLTIWQGLTPGRPRAALFTSLGLAMMALAGQFTVLAVTAVFILVLSLTTSRHASDFVQRLLGFGLRLGVGLALSGPAWWPAWSAAATSLVRPPEPMAPWVWRGAEGAVLFLLAAASGLIVRWRDRRIWCGIGFAAAAMFFVLGNEPWREMIWHASRGLIDVGFHSLWLFFAQLCGAMVGTLGLNRLQAIRRGNIGLLFGLGAMVGAHLLTGIGGWLWSKQTLPSWVGLTGRELQVRASLHMILALVFGGLAIAAALMPEKRRLRATIWLVISLVVAAEVMVLRPRSTSVAIHQVAKTAGPLTEVERDARILYLGLSDANAPTFFNPPGNLLLGLTAYGFRTRMEELRHDVLSESEILANLKQWAMVLGLRYILTPAGYEFEHREDYEASGLVRRLPQGSDDHVTLYRIERTSSRVAFTRTIRFANSENEAQSMVVGRGDARSPVILERREAYRYGKQLPPTDSYWSDWLPSFGGEETLLSQTPVVVTSARDSAVERNYEFLGASASVFILRETFSPDWRVYISDQEVPSMRADLVNRAVFLKKGKQAVRLVYQPKSWTYSLFLAVCGALTLIFWLWRSYVQYRDSRLV